MTILVLHHPHDPVAAWALHGLHERGLDAEGVEVDALVHAPRWEQRLEPDGRASALVALPDGRELDSARVRGVLNRAQAAPPGGRADLLPSDRDYAGQETHALLLAFLDLLPGPLLNPPDPNGLGGAWRPPLAWARLAARAGLPVAPLAWRAGPDGLPPAPDVAPRRAVAVAAGRAWSAPGAPVPPGIAAGCVALARAAGLPLLQVLLGDGPAGAWTFAAASPLPDLRLGGDALLDALAGELAAGAPA